MSLRILPLLSLFLISWNANTQCVRNGTFQDGNYEMDGSVTLEYTTGGSKLLKIEDDFSTSTGPDLYVYLSNSTDFETGPSTTPDNVEELGLLSSEVSGGTVSGSSTYDIPQNVNIGDYKYVVIQCKAFNALWGFAELGETEGAACSVLKSDNQLFTSIKFYPNPAKDGVNFENNYYEGNIFVNLYNLTGRLVIKNQIIEIGRQKLSLEGISSGIYFIEIVSERKSSVKKLIVI